MDSRAPSKIESNIEHEDESTISFQYITRLLPTVHHILEHRTRLQSEAQEKEELA